MAKRPPFYHIPGGGPPHPVRDAQIKALTPGAAKAPAAARASAIPVTANVSAASFAAQPPLTLAGGALTIAAASGARDGYLAQSDWIEFDAKEPSLGSPALSGLVLASTTDGVRSWAALPAVPSFADSETPVGTINGANAAFTVAHAPATGSLRVYKGASATTLQRLAPSQYSVSGTTLTLAAAPVTGSSLLVDYRY